MSDDAERRERKTFEPPPWERDQFEELARLKAGEQERQAAEEAACRESVAAEARADENAAQPSGETKVAGGPPEGTASVPAEKPKPAVVEDAKLQAMLLELSGEEHSAVQEVRRAGVVAAGALATAGSVILGLGAVLLIRGGDQGFAGAGMIAAVGMFVIGFAVWLGYRAGRGQGS
jgi:hypothetical protein